MKIKALWRKLRASYVDPCCDRPVAIDLTDWQKAFAQIMQDTYEGRIKPGELSQADIQDTYQKVSDGAAKGYGKGWDVHAPEKEHDSSTIDPKVLQMKRNLYKFSAAKDAAMLQALNDAMYKNGKLLPYDEFRQEAMKIGAQFKEHWLQAEYQTARQSGIMAQKWNDIQANKKLFPNLRYRTQHDDRVRPEHAALDGIVAPIDSEFWKKYYPPNGWRCRCDAVQTAEDPTALVPNLSHDVKPEFENNIGESGQVFREDGSGQNSFFALAKEDPKWQASFERSKLEAPRETVHKSENGATVDQSIFADPHDLDLNRSQAMIIADKLGLNVTIRPHVDTNADFLPGYTNPEFEIEGLLADRKSQKSLNNLGKVIDEAKKQMFDTLTNKDKKDYIVCFDLDEVKEFDWENVYRQLGAKVQKNRGTHIDSIIFTRNGNAVRLTRAELVKRDYSKLDKIK